MHEIFTENYKPGKLYLKLGTSKKNERDKNRDRFNQLKQQCFQCILNAQAVGFTSHEFEYNDNLPKSYFNRLKKFFEDLNIDVGLVKQKNSYVILFNWEDVLYNNVKKYIESK